MESFDFYVTQFKSLYYILKKYYKKTIQVNNSAYAE